MRYLAASRRWLSDYISEKRDIIGKSHYEVFPESPPTMEGDSSNAVWPGRSRRATKSLFTGSDGRTDWVRWEVRPWYDRAGKIGGVIMFTEVITERKQMEEELRRSHDEMELRVKERTAELQQSRERFQTLVDLLPEAVFEVDLKGRCTYANRQTLQYIGRTFQELDRGDINLFDLVSGGGPPKGHGGCKKDFSGGGMAGCRLHRQRERMEASSLHLSMPAG